MHESSMSPDETVGGSHSIIVRKKLFVCDQYVAHKIQQYRWAKSEKKIENLFPQTLAIPYYQQSRDTLCCQGKIDSLLYVHRMGAKPPSRQCFYILRVEG